MIKYFCDNCSKETEELHKMTEASYATLELCEACHDKISDAFESARNAFNTVRQAIINKYFKVSEPLGVQEHEHVWPDRPGVISHDAETTTLHYHCSVHGCKESKQEERPR